MSNISLQNVIWTGSMCPVPRPGFYTLCPAHSGTSPCLQSCGWGLRSPPQVLEEGDTFCAVIQAVVALRPPPRSLSGCLPDAAAWVS